MRRHRRNSAALSVEKLRVVHEYDEDSRPETSGEPDYEEEEQERIESWRRDEWHYLGVYMECTLVVNGTMQTIRTPGVWGIESDSGREYFAEMAQEEYGALADILGALGVPRSAMPPLSSAREVQR